MLQCPLEVKIVSLCNVDEEHKYTLLWGDPCCHKDIPSKQFRQLDKLAANRKLSNEYAESALSLLVKTGLVSYSVEPWFRGQGIRVR